MEDECLQDISRGYTFIFYDIIFSTAALNENVVRIKTVPVER